MRWLVKGIVMGALISLFHLSTAQAFTTIMKPNGQPMRWGQTHIKWYLNPAGCADLSFEKTKASLEAAIQSWSEVSCSSLTFEYAGTSTQSVPGAIYFYFDPAFSYQGVDGVLAYAGPTGDVVFNESYTWTDVAVNGQGTLKDLQAVATHELGHVFGLLHSMDPKATMYFVGGAMNERKLGQDDRNGLCFLYPAPGFIFTEGTNCDYCAVQSNCPQGKCVPHSWEGGSYCADYCAYDSQCPIGFRCKNNGPDKVCMPEFNHCTQSGYNIPFGDYCWGHQNCATGLCYASGKGQYDSFCAASCEQGQSCPASSECAYGSICIPLECDPVEDLGCTIGKQCLWYNKQASGPGADTVTGRCVNENDGGNQGAICGENLPGCQPNLTCVYVDWQDNYQCVPDCRFPSGLGCDGSSSCVANAESGHPERGFCVPKQPTRPSPDLVQIDDTGSIVTNDSFANSDGQSTPKLPGAPKPPPPEHPGSSTLCSSAPGKTNPMNRAGFWLIATVAFLLVRKTRRPAPGQRPNFPEADLQSRT